MKNILDKLNNYRKYIMLAVDLAIINASMFLAFMIRYDWYLDQPAILTCLQFMFWASVIKIGLLLFFGMYTWSFHYASVSEAIGVLKVSTLGSLLLITVAFFTKNIVISRSVLLIDYFIFLFLITASRFFPRVLIKFRQIRSANFKKLLIVGAGAAGELVARQIVNSKERGYLAIGFIDDNPVKLGSRIHGIKVLGKTGDIKKVVKDYFVDELIIAIPSASGRTIRNIISKCERADVKIKILPKVHKILTGELSVSQIRDVDPEDLLGRDMVEINPKDFSSFLKNKVVLVTGAAGTVGAELCRQIAAYEPKRLVMCDYNENETCFLRMELEKKYDYVGIETIIGDIKDISLLKSLFSRYRPNVVFHSAAHKHVPLMEMLPSAAVKNNIIGTRNIVYAAEHYKTERFVMISTDKAVNPTSVMGASKRISEMIIQAKAKKARTKFMAVRFGNVIGSSGSVVPIFKKQIEQGGPVTVTHPEVKRFFMTVNEAAQLVIQAGSMGKGGEIFILDMGEQIKIGDLAKNLITLSGLEPGEDIEIVFTGLRPGEKMYEETLLDIEHDKATKHEKIFIAQPDEFDNLQLQKDIKTLERLSRLMDEDKIVDKMKRMVPRYSPSNNGKR